MSHYKLLITFVFLCSALNIRAQYGVSATVVDNEGAPEEYATFRIFAIPDTIRPVVGNITADDGLINATLPRSGNYRMVVSAMMKQPITVEFTVSPDNPEVNLGTLTTEYAGQMLNELTVAAQRPLVSKEIDRIGYDVQADAEASTSTLSEILKKVPLVSVESDGTIRVNGSDNYKVYRNGRPNNGFSKNAKDIFSAIPASTIKKIEVITDPGAREDADSSGMILNIVTTSTSTMQGLTGSLGASYGWNRGPQANAFIMSQVKKLTFSGSGGYYGYFKSNTGGSMESTMKYDQTGSTMIGRSDYRAGGNGGWFNIDASLEIDTLNLISTSLNGFVARNSHDMCGLNTMYNSEGDIDYSYTSNSYYRKNGYTDIDFSIDYQRSTRLKGEAITLSYRLSHTRQDMDQTTDYAVIAGNPFPYSSNLSDFDLRFFEHTFQLDWTRPLGRHYILDTGAKYILRTSHSTNHQTLVDLLQTFDDFKHRYDIFGIYADGRASYGRLTARAGLRYEYSRLSADFLTGDNADFHANLNDVVPNASLALTASQSSSWKLSYNRRIQRPGITYLNPAVSEAPNSVSYGNPNLQSTTIDNLILNYSLIKPKFNLDLTASFAFSNNGTGAVQWTDENNVTFSTYDNLMKSRNFTVSGFFQWQIAAKTSWMFNGNFSRVKYMLNIPSGNAELARFTGYFFTRVQQKLPWELNLTVGANYFAGFCNSPYQYMSNPASSIGYSIGLKRSFLKSKTLDIGISADNIGLKDRKMYTYFLNNGTTGSQQMLQHHRQQVTVSVNWRFGNLRARVKKASTTINNDDLDGRKSGGDQSGNTP